MQTHQTSPTPRADAIAGFNDPSFGDEREANIMLRGTVVGMQVATYASFLAALLLAAGGAGFFSALPIFAAAAGGQTITWYCNKHGVSYWELFDRANRGRRWTYWTIAALITAAWIGVLAFHMLTGSPLVSVSPLLGTDDPSGTLIGGIAGAVAGLAAVAVISKLMAGRARRREAEAPDED